MIRNLQVRWGLLWGLGVMWETVLLWPESGLILDMRIRPDLWLHFKVCLIGLLITGRIRLRRFDKVW